MTNSWEVIIEEDEHGELILPFPPELIKKYNWLEGDEIEFEIKEGFVVITNTTAKTREQENGVG